MPEIDGSKSAAEALADKYKGGQMDEVELPAEAAELLQRYNEGSEAARKGDV